jgi:hypothetical protein
VPPEWLTATTVEPDIPSVVDRRTSEEDMMPSVFSEPESKRPARQRGGLFGRGAKRGEPAQAEEASEGDPDDIRSLLS